jgi:hypothetical protein
MTSSTHATPSPRAVRREQVRTVAFALRGPAIIAATLLGVLTLVMIVEYRRDGRPIDFGPELSMIPAMIGALLPFLVWKRGAWDSGALLWTLPVDRWRHALAKTYAGWVSLMAAVAVFLLWLLVLALVTGGNILGEQSIRLLPSAVIPAPGTLDQSALRTVQWGPTPLLWLAPVFGATGLYLLGSALVLAVRHPLRWIAGALVLLVLGSGLGAAAGVDWLRLGPSNLITWLQDTPLGLDALLSGRAESLHTFVTLSNGESVEVWRGLPELTHWTAATALWIGIGVVALLAAASRHRENRPA